MKKKIFHTGTGPLASTEDRFPGPDNPSKMRRSVENAEHVGMYMNHALVYLIIETTQDFLPLELVNNIVMSSAVVVLGLTVEQLQQSEKQLFIGHFRTYTEQSAVLVTALVEPLHGGEIPWDIRILLINPRQNWINEIMDVAVSVLIDYSNFDFLHFAMLYS